jgi:hypothetical protein
MKTSVYLDKELEKLATTATDQVKEKPATVLRMALRIGLPLLIEQHTPKKSKEDSTPEGKNTPQKRTA